VLALGVVVLVAPTPATAVSPGPVEQVSGAYDLWSTVWPGAVGLIARPGLRSAAARPIMDPNGR
jgi:hypothetical protein